MVWFRVLAVAAWLAAGAWPRAATSEATPVGPAYDRFRLTLEPGERTEAFGPLYYSQTLWEDAPAGLGPLELPGDATAVQTAAETIALPPIFSTLKRPQLEASSWDLFYPVITYDRYGAEYRLQFGQLLSFSGGKSAGGDDAHGFSLFPLIFFRRASDPTQNYSAVLPFYGHMQKRLFRDEVTAIMWPLYAQTRKKDVVTDNYLVPLFHLRHGDGLRGWQFWPLIGHEHKDVTTRTNAFGDLESTAARDAFFVMWPLFFRNTVDIGTTNEIRQRTFLPFFNFQLSAAKDTRTYLWPLGPTFVDARAEGYRQVGVPWPLIVFARGEGKTTDRVFPLYSHSRYRDGETTWYAWPVWWHRHSRSPALERDILRLGFFAFTDITDRNVATGQVSRRTDLWPLFITRRDYDGNERFQMLAPIEAILPSNPSVIRNWSPLWSIWRSERNARTGATSQSMLWNLYRYERVGGTKKCSLLFGLVQYHNGPNGAGWRWLHLFGHRPPPTTTTTNVPEHR